MTAVVEAVRRHVGAGLTMPEATAAAYRELVGALLAGGLDAPGDPLDLPAALGRLHEAVLEATDPRGRRRAGSWFTPRPLVEHLLDRALEPLLDEVADPATVTVLDPSCGPGAFLVAAAARIARRGVPPARAVRQVHGVDLDPAALELARAALTALVPAGPADAMPPLHLAAADALTGWDPPREFDVVIGNPPFLNQLERRTASARATAACLAERAGGALGPYTDLSAVFLHRALGWVRPGGRVALVQPQSLLGARDAGGVRRHAARTCALEHLWASDEPVFDATVLTCAPVLRRGAVQGAVTRSHGRAFTAVADAVAPDLSAEWSPLLAAALGIPEVRLRADAGRLGDLAACTADFRDQYYGLAGAVHEAADHPAGVPLVTSGLLDPAACGWGRRPARFHKRRWEAPVVDVAVLAGTPLAAWAAARLVPKVLVATQGRLVEAVVDERGEWLPSVPVVTVMPERELLWHVLAVLLAPPVSAYAAAAYAGTALSMRAVKLSARQVAALPLPVDRDAWDEGAALAQEAQQQAQGRSERLAELGTAMCRAYAVAGAEVLSWWTDRVSRRR